VTIAEPLDGRSLLALLQTVLAVGSVGCSTTDERVVSYPWRAAEQRLVLGEPVDAETCRQICVKNQVTWRAGLGHLTTDECQLTRVELSRPVGRDPDDPAPQVACLARTARSPLPYREEASYFRPLPHQLTGLAKEGRLMSLDRQSCRQICLPPDTWGGSPTVFEDFCTIYPVIPEQPMPPESVFVECIYPNGQYENFDTRRDPSRPGTRSRGSPDWLRLPAGRVPPGAPGFRTAARSVAEFALQAAHAEAQSVSAFEVLALELRAQGAPPAWSRRARAFARDEVRHARAWLEVAERGRGASLEVPPVPGPVRRTESLAQLAIDNVVSGCIGETHGAWLLLRQAACARDGRLRALAQRIALDEAEHAAFAFEIHAWLWPQLQAAERSALMSAALVAMVDMHRPLPASPAVARRAGLPSTESMAREQAPLVRALQGWLSGTA